MTPILPSFLFLACSLDLLPSVLSSWQWLIQMPPEQRGEGQVKRHAWKVLETKLGWLGLTPCSIRPILASPFFRLLVLPWQLYGRFQVAWSLFFSCIFQLAQLCRGKGRKGESASGPDLPPGVHHLHLPGGEGMKCPSPAFLWWKWEWAVHPSFSLGEDTLTA